MFQTNMTRSAKQNTLIPELYNSLHHILEQSFFKRLNKRLGCGFGLLLT